MPLSKDGQIRSVYLAMSVYKRRTFVCFFVNKRTNDKLPLYVYISIYLYICCYYGKRKFFFHGWQTKNGSRRLMRQPTCPSLPLCYLRSTPRASSSILGGEQQGASSPYWYSALLRRRLFRSMCTDRIYTYNVTDSLGVLNGLLHQSEFG